MNSLTHQNADSQFLLYQTEDGHTRIEVQFRGETAWLSLNQLAELFQRDKSVISKHIRNVFDEGELASEATVAKYATVQAEGSRQVSRDIEYYNLVSKVEKDFLLAAKRVEKLGKPNQDKRIPRKKK